MNIKLKAIPPKDPDPQYKAALHRTGKIGLAVDTATAFGIDTSKAVELFINEADEQDKNIYARLVDAKTERTYKVNKGGSYHSINAKDFFDSLEMDYENIAFQYLVSKIIVDGTSLLKFELVSEKVRGAQELSIRL